MRPTLRFAYWFLLLLLNYVAFSYFRLPILRLFLLANIALLLLALLQLYLNYHMLEVSLLVQRPYVQRGQRARWLLRLNNKSRFTALPIRIYAEEHQERVFNWQNKRLLLGTIEAKSASTALLSLPTQHCGTKNVDKFYISVGELFGFFYRRIPAQKLFTAEKSVTVLPLADRDVLLSEAALQFVEEGEQQAQRPFEESTELDQLRHLRDGDALKRIHWKLSARVNEWMVKQYRPEDEIVWTLLCDVQTITQYGALDPEQRESCLDLRDYALDAAAALVEEGLMAKRRLQIRVYKNKTETLHLSGTELNLYPEFLILLAQAPAEAGVTLAEQIEREKPEGARHPYILITSAPLLPESKQLLLFLQEKTEVFLLHMPFADGLESELHEQYTELRAAGMKVELLPFRAELSKPERRDEEIKVVPR